MKKITKPFDYVFLLLVLALLGTGLAVLYSASTVESYQNFGNTTYYFKHQFLYGACIGLTGMYVASRIDYHLWQKYLPYLLALSFLLLALVKIPGIGWRFNGADRWIHVGFIFFQPAELAKLVIIFYLAAWADKKRSTLNNFYFGLLPSLCIIALFSLLILWQPDMGTMLVIIGISAVMLFTAGISWRNMFWLLISGVLTLVTLIKLEPYRARRLTTFLDPSVDPKGISYQINQAVLAIGAGGLWGYGYGLSRQKHNYLPEALGDSVFAVMAEELGFIRVVVVLLLFVFFALKGFSIARSAPDMFGKMVAIGVTGWVVVQAFINIGAMIRLLPLTGVPLPFFSYGSSSLMVMLVSIGIVLNISRQSKT